MSSVLWSDNEKRQRRIWRRLVKSKGSRGRGRQRVIILGDPRLWHDGILSIQLIEITKERDLEKDEAVASYGKTRDIGERYQWRGRCDWTNGILCCT